MIVNDVGFGLYFYLFVNQLITYNVVQCLFHRLLVWANFRRKQWTGIYFNNDKLKNLKQDLLSNRI